MDQLKLNAESITEMKSFYQEELTKTLRRLEHINGVLSQLGGKITQVDISFSESNSSRRKTKISTAKRKYKKKRGPKSKWDKAIIKTIVSAGRPLSYDEITNYLMISEGRDASKRKNTKATVQNTVFRLRHDKKLRTFSMGARTKYIAPKTWFESNGEIRAEFKNKVIVPKKAKKPRSKTSKRGPGRPRKKVSSVKPKVVAKSTNKAKTTTAKRKPSTKVSTSSPTKSKAGAKKKVSKPVVRKASKKKTSTPPKQIAKKASPRKTASAQKKKTAVKSSTKSPVVKKSSQKKTTAKKKVDPKIPRKLAMTKTVKIKRKK